jgi:SSS family solute:Na+ symporter
MLLYFAFVLGIGIALKSSMKTSRDFFLAGRSFPTWICALAFIGASLGAPEVIAAGAAGARYGLPVAVFFGIGAIPAMLFVGVFMMPIYYGSKARSVPEYLGLRFDGKTRLLNACLFAAMMAVSSGISMCVMARLIQSLHLLDGVSRMLGMPPQGVFPLSVVLLAGIVLAYVFLSGLAGTIYNQALQFCLLVAGFLPMVLLGLRSVGGWSGLKSALPATCLHQWQGVTGTGSSPMGIEVLGLWLGLCFVLVTSYWCADLRVLQTALAAKDVASSRRVPLVAAIFRMFLPFLVILPGLVAIALPTPHSTTVVREEMGAIIHTTTVVRPEAEAGQGLVPAKVDPATGKLMLSSGGRPILDYDMATPNMLLHFLPSGLLGLGLAALLACFMSGLAASVTAFNTVFTCDIYQAHLHKGAADAHYLAVGRWATVGGVLLSIMASCAVFRFDSIIDAFLLIFALVMAPLIAVVLLGMFWKRATGHGAFWGLLAGTCAALFHHGLTLPTGSYPGLHGGWIVVLHNYSSDLNQSFWTALFAFSVSCFVAIVVSYCTQLRPESELVGLVHSLTKRPRYKVWWKSPEALAVAILIVAIALNLFLA